MEHILKIAREFAASLDAEDYDSAAKLLSEACEYQCRGTVHRGPQDIISSYLAAGTSAHEDFDEVIYESHVEQLNDRMARISFIDHFRKGKHALSYRCQQEITVDKSGDIVNISHIDLPGERQKLGKFLLRLQELTKL